ncbi:protein phosphatase 2A regulatory subunit PR55, partial [Kipferlia bialata]
KTIKLWKVSKKHEKQYTPVNFPGAAAAYVRHQQGVDLTTKPGMAKSPKRPPLTIPDATPECPMGPGPQRPQEIRVPRAIPPVDGQQETVSASPQRVFRNASAYHINSLCPLADSEHFLSADDLSISLWDLNHTGRAFMCVDLRPPVIDELTELITCASAHHSDASLFGYGTCKGRVVLCDLRDRACLDGGSTVLDPSASSSSGKGKSGAFYT